MRTIFQMTPTALIASLLFGGGCASQSAAPGRPAPTSLDTRGATEVPPPRGTDAGPTTREADGPAPGTCRATGCSGQICADDDMMSTCELKPHYRCFRLGRCERQADGRCDWTITPELRSCITKTNGGN